MDTIAIVLLMVASFGAIAWPFLGQRRLAEERPRLHTTWDDLLSQRDTAYRALQELEFEHNLGNLSDRDYAELKARYRAHAASILRQLDMAAEQLPVAEAEADPSAPEAAEDACPSCDEPVAADDAYCWNCGADLGDYCEECGEAVFAEDEFCAACGHRLGIAS